MVKKILILSSNTSEGVKSARLLSSRGNQDFCKRAKSGRNFFVQLMNGNGTTSLKNVFDLRIPKTLLKCVFLYKYCRKDKIFQKTRNMLWRHKTLFSNDGGGEIALIGYSYFPASMRLFVFYQLTMLSDDIKLQSASYVYLNIANFAWLSPVITFI